MKENVAGRWWVQIHVGQSSCWKTVNSAVKGTCFESEKDKAAKGEGCVLPFICCAQDPVGL